MYICLWQCVGKTGIVHKIDIDGDVVVELINGLRYDLEKLELFRYGRCVRCVTYQGWVEQQKKICSGPTKIVLHHHRVYPAPVSMHCFDSGTSCFSTF